MVKSVQSLVKQYSNPKLGKFSIEGLDENLKSTLAVLIDNQMNMNSKDLFENDALSQTPTNGIDYDATQGDKFKPIALAMVRRAMPITNVLKWMPSQAIQTPVGLAYAYRLTDDKGQELWKPGQLDSFLGMSGANKETLFEAFMRLAPTTPSAPSLTTADNIKIDTDANGDFSVGGFRPAVAGDVSSALAETPSRVIALGSPVATAKVTILASAVFGATTASAEDWYIKQNNLADGAYADGGANKMRQTDFRLETTPVFAKTRKLGSSYSLEDSSDIRNMTGLDIHKDMVDVLHSQVASEIDREGLYRMKKLAIAGDGGVKKIITINIPVSSASASVMGRYSAEILDTLVKNVIYQANDIFRTTRRGIGNFVICSAGIASALQFAPGFTQAPGYKADVQVGSQLEVGRLNNGIVVYMDADSHTTNEWFLVGFKGAGNQDGGAIFSPYQMSVQAEGQSIGDFSTRVGVMSRYAFTDSLLGSGRYYRYCEVTGFNNIGLTGGV